LARYVVISPVKDEERYIRTTLESIIGQTVRPLHWVIVDDGSSDRTPEIVEEYRQQHPWITLVRLARRSTRLIGFAEVVAFDAGRQMLPSDNYDFIVKLDGDLRIPATYFERLLERFEQAPQLGIASGMYQEKHGEMWRVVSMPSYHAAGACKVVRAKCFSEIRGFVFARGWDTVDEIRAQTLGWETCHFPDLVFDHLRSEGAARGSLFTGRLHGEVYYMTGGSWSFFLLKVLHRMVVGRPPVLEGVMLAAGFLKPWLLRRPRLVSAREAGFYRRALMNRMRSSVAAAGSRVGLRLDSESRS
jgi:poly-beta-1,6-N-acetyl-D-glucosamine synthase